MLKVMTGRICPQAIAIERQLKTGAQVKYCWGRFDSVETTWKYVDKKVFSLYMHHMKFYIISDSFWLKETQQIILFFLILFIWCVQG